MRNAQATIDADASAAVETEYACMKSMKEAHT